MRGGGGCVTECPAGRAPQSHVIFQNINQNKRTLLPKFYGLYCVQTGGKNIRILVMNNLLPRARHMHLKYDLKGSTCKRQASPKEREKALPTYKDLDFIQNMPDGLHLEPENYNALSKTIQRDCLVSMLPSSLVCS